MLFDNLQSNLTGSSGIIAKAQRNYSNRGDFQHVAVKIVRAQVPHRRPGCYLPAHCPHLAITKA